MNGNMRMTSAALALLLAASSTPAAAQFAGGDQDNGQHSMTILGMPISPRGVGLGEAMAAVDRDPAAIWYNAAGLAGLQTNAFIVTASQRFALTQLVGVAAAFPTEIASFGVAARAFNAGTIEGRREQERSGGNQRAFQYVLEGGGALQLARAWRFGGTLYFSQETLGNETQGSVGINSGMQFPEIIGRLTPAFGIRNFGTNVGFDEGVDKKFSPPLTGYVGAGFDLFRQRNLLQTPLLFRGQPIIIDAKVLAQLTVPDKSELYGAFGIEATVNGVAVGRLGYQTGDDNRAGISLGAGVNVGQFRLEYAFRDYQNAGAGFFTNDPVGDAQNVSFSFFWGDRKVNSDPRVPVVAVANVDTAALNQAVRDAIAAQMAELRPLLDSLRNSRVEVIQSSDLTAKYIVPVHFAFDSDVVPDSELVVLGQVADVIKRIYPSAIVTIEGFADPAGSVEYNRKLSLRRAQSVKEVMVTRFGMPERQFKTVGYGEQGARQVFPGAAKDDSGADRNRRVTFTIDATTQF